MDKVEYFNNKIANAYDTLQKCKENDSQWGVNYWQTVVNTLLRRLNNE